jgi:hypothetical protein
MPEWWRKVLILKIPERVRISTSDAKIPEKYKTNSPEPRINRRTKMSGFTKSPTAWVQGGGMNPA